MFKKFKLYILIVLSIKNFWIVLLNQFKLLKGEQYVLKFRNGLSFITRPNDADINEAAIVGLGVEYPVNVIASLQKGSSVIDLGGHIGSFSILLSSKRKDLKIFAIEPSSENYELLLKNIKLNKLTNIKPLNMAVSNFSGYGLLDISGDADAWKIDEKPKLSEKVSVFRLEDIIKNETIRNISLIKMDIEGEEYNVLQDSGSVLKDCANIFVEFHKSLKDGIHTQKEGGEYINNYLKTNGFIIDYKDWHLIYASKQK